MLSRTKGWRWTLLWLSLVKIGYLVGTYAALRWWSDLDEEIYFKVMRHWPMEGSPAFASHFGTWDGAHYLYLSTMGYAAGVNSCAFYPLWPLVIRWFSILTGGSHLIAGMLLANVFSLMAWTVFYHVTARRFGESVALWALVLLIVFPGSIFYQFTYSEPLFFLLVMALWLTLEREQCAWACVAAFLLPLSRPVGIFCVLPIAWFLVTKKPLSRPSWLEKSVSRQKEVEGNVQNTNLVSAQKNWRYYGLLVAPLFGLAVYFALMWGWTGNPLEGIQAQRYWGAHSILNLVNAPKFIIGFCEPTTWHDFRGSVLDRCMFMLLLYCLPLIWRLGKDLVVWAYVLGILPAMSGTFTSFTRFESTAFPMFIALAVFFTSLKQKSPLVIWIVLSAVLHGILLWRFVNFRWAG